MLELQLACRGCAPPLNLTQAAALDLPATICSTHSTPLHQNACITDSRTKHAYLRRNTRRCMRPSENERSARRIVMGSETPPNPAQTPNSKLQRKKSAVPGQTSCSPAHGWEAEACFIGLAWRTLGFRVGEFEGKRVRGFQALVVEVVLRRALEFFRTPFTLFRWGSM